MFELFNRFFDVIQCPVDVVLDNTIEHFRPPARSQLLDGRDINISVVQEVFQLRHISHEEAPILADAVATQRGAALADVLL